MIYICGIDNDNFGQVSVEHILEYFAGREFVQFDTETTGLVSRSSDIVCFQLGDYDNQFVVSGDKILQFKDLLELKTLVGQNIKFDLTFLYKYDIYPSKVWDTFLAESVITCGIQSIRRNLAAIAKRRLDIDLDKTVRDVIIREGFTDRVIEYAAADVKYLEQIRDSQLEDIAYHDLKHALEVENQFVIVLAYIEYCGFKLDEDCWKKKIEADLIDFNVAEEALDDYILMNHPEYIDAQVDMFKASYRTTINWSSSRQVVELFKKIGVPVKAVIKGEEKETVDAKAIERYSQKYKIVELYLKYKKAQKEVSTYGQNFIDQINPTTSRLHTIFKQVMDTGRLSSGGKDKATKSSFINFQNIPTDKATRACFVSEKGNTLIIADYSGQEQVVLANRSLDKGLLEFYDKGLADMHSFVASKMYPELKGLTVEEIKEKHSDKRYNAKTAGFAINYGGVGATIARNNNMSLEGGEAVYEAYFEAFPDLKDYFEVEKKKGLKLGYIQFNDIIKTKSFIEGYDDFLALSESLNRQFWDRWKMVKEAVKEGKCEDEYVEMKAKFRRYFKIKGAIERKALNYPIQGTSATITKIAGIYFFRWLRENNYIGTVLIANAVHDEYVVECPASMGELVRDNLKECMVRAGAIFCKRVPLKVDAKISPFWQK